MPPPSFRDGANVEHAAHERLCPRHHRILLRHTDTGFAKAVTDAGTGALKQLSDTLDDGQLATVARAMESALDGSAQTLSSTAGSVQAAGDLVGSAQRLLDASPTSLSALTDTEGGLAAALRDGANGVRGLDGTLKNTTASVKGALDAGAASLDGVSDAIGSAMETVGGHIERLTSALTTVDNTIQQRLDALRTVADSLNGQDTLVKQMESHYQVGSAGYTKIHEVSLTIDGLSDRVDLAIKELENLSAGIEGTVGDLEQGRTDAEGAQAELTQMVSDAQGALTTAGDSLNTSLDGSLADLASTLEATATGADAALQDLEQTGAAVAAATQAATWTECTPRSAIRLRTSRAPRRASASCRASCPTPSIRPTWTRCARFF
ncbi:hypothetical protein [Collinsella intestinalis]|uniref:hypothetical protein n=1 Tax=Collinsella intestinalis TaxID=147207 RepID=UPI00315D47A1